MGASSLVGNLTSTGANLLGSVRDQFLSLYGRVWGSTLVQNLFARYRALSERDQTALRILAIFALVLIVYYLVLGPARDYAKSAKRDYLANQETYQWMQANSSRLESSQKDSNSGRGDHSLLSLASNSAKAYDMSFKRFEPVEGGALRLWLEQVPFDEVVQWIESLDKTYNIALREIMIDPSSIPGLVTVKVVLQE